MTLLEILIVVSIIIALAIVVLIALNPQGQINKANDGKRKSDMATLRKVLEDWYNDKNCYPIPSQICYDAPSGNTCHICGQKTTSPNFSPYLPSLPCDPSDPYHDYLYQFDNSICPTQYQIYTNLSNTSDPAIISTGCLSGCGPGNSYNYGVSSPNSGLVNPGPTPTSAPTATPTPTQSGIYCSTQTQVYILAGGICNICGDYTQCQNNYPGATYFIKDNPVNPTCTVSCIKN